MATNYSSLFVFSACNQLMSPLCLCLLLLAPVYAQNRSDEVKALQVFTSQSFNIVTNNGVNWTRGGNWITWNFSDENACAWVGVTCTANFTVAELDLSGWGIFSVTFEPLSSLRDLHHLDLSYNNLGTWGESLFSLNIDESVQFSPDIGTLTGLTWLDISNNNIIDQFPYTIGACRRLRFLSLENNAFSGAIQTSTHLTDLKDLQFLFLAHNQFSGPFPIQLTESSNLVSIDLSYNNFSGSIPTLPNLTKLTGLKLDNNSFTKFEESWFSTISQSLQVLSVSFNQLEDVLRSKITVRDLQVFNMTSNRLSGNIPWFSEPRLYGFSVDLSQNSLTGKIPTDLFYTGFSYNFLNLSYNFLTGNVPFNDTLGNNFKILDLSHNNLSGIIPSDTFNFTSIGILRLGTNQLSGNIVDILNHGSYTNSSSLLMEELRLENNLFTGDLSMLTELGASFLILVGVLDLTNNHLRWSVSAGVADPITATFEKLLYISFMREFLAGGNNFSGTSLPTACVHRGFVSSNMLQVLDLSSTHLNGQIQTTAFNGSCFPLLQSLDLSNNDIVGIVPDSIVAIPQLEVLDLSNNHLSGQLPLFLSNTSLNNPRFFEGNDGLCGYPLPSCPQLIGTAGIIRWWVLLLIIGGCVIIALGSCLIATWRWRVYHERHQQDADLIKTLLERESTTLMPLRELMKATKNFAKSAQIGEGGFGTVYVGKLDNGTTVALKRSKREGSLKDKEQFLNEVRILSQVNHRNLVKLLGCCMENNIAVLVFEYIPNGTLQEHLSGKIGADCLTWKQRLNIAVQTADALNYLHSAAILPIYHRDVKSANILLDDNCNAKVADFGISKLAPLEATHVSTIAIQGTMGYIDPEYYASYQLTDKSDVYSFGVVLLELISAKPALDYHRGGDKTSLVYFASSYIEMGDLEGLVDPNLTETYDDPVGSGRRSILAFSKLAMKCLDMHSKARLSMSKVLRELQSLWTNLEEKSNDLEDSIYGDDSEALDCHTLMLSQFSSKDSSSFAMEIDGSSI